MRVFVCVGGEEWGVISVSVWRRIDDLLGELLLHQMVQRVHLLRKELRRREALRGGTGNRGTPRVACEVGLERRICAQSLWK